MFFLRFARMVFSNTILCIDDDPDDLVLIQEAIKQQETRFDVVEARDGEQALTFLYQARNKGTLPCLIIMDVNMPKMDGKKALELIREDESLRTIPLVIFSTSSNAFDKTYFERYQVHFITKPSHYHSFIGKVLEMLSFHRK